MRTAFVGTAFPAHRFRWQSFLKLLSRACRESVGNDFRWPTMLLFRGAEVYLKQARSGNTTKVQKSFGIGQPFLIYT